MKKLLSVVLCVLVCASAYSATHYVDLNSPNPTPPYTSWGTAAISIQDAVDVAISNDVVLVADGHYYLTSTITVNTLITIESVNGPQGAIVNGGGITSCFALLVDYQILLTGFTITNGLTTGNGGGVYCSGSTPVVSNCTISGNTVIGSGGRYGGGMCGGTANNCTISGNTVAGNDLGYGGGMYDGTANNCTISGNTVAGNDGGYGGGMSRGTANNCTISGNTATSDVYNQGGYGGGMSRGTANNCTISGNTATGNGNNGFGGGVYQGTANNCTINGNRANGTGFSWDGFSQVPTSGQGGGMYGGTANGCAISENFSRAYGAGTCYSTLFSCTVSNNYGLGSGGGMYQGTAYHCIIAGNSCLPFSGTPHNGGGAYNSILYNCMVIDNSSHIGGGVYDGEAYNCTFIDNIAVYRGDTCNSTNTTTANIYNSVIAYVNKTPKDSRYVFLEDISDWVPVYYSCSPYLEDGLYGCVSADPRFADSTNGNYRLAPDSPCINQGVNALSQTDTDLDGNPRIVNGTVDMGAYEYQGGSLADDDGDGISTAVELQLGTNPYDPDTDGDGFDDGAEVSSGLNPLVADNWIVPYVTNNAVAFGLNLSGGYIDVAVGQMLLSTTNGEAHLSLQLEQSDDLVIWTNAADAVQWVLPVDTDKQFFRVRAEP